MGVVDCRYPPDRYSQHREFRDTVLCRTVSDIGNLPDGGFVNPDESFAADDFTLYCRPLYEKQDKQVLPNLTGAISGYNRERNATGLCLVYLFTGPVLYGLLMLSGLVVLSTIWIVVIVLSGLKAYAEILLAFLVGYGITVLGAMQLGEYDWKACFQVLS